MGRKLHYKAGSFYRTDDRTGFPQRAERTRREWTGLIVDENVWEPRQPQDLVKGVKDNQSVPDARPLGPAQYVGPISVQTTADAVIGQTVIPVQTTFGFYGGAKVGCMTDYDGGTVFFTTIESITASLPLDYEVDEPLLYDVGKPLLTGSGVGSGPYLVLAVGLPYSMASGNLITLYTPSPPAQPGL